MRCLTLAGMLAKAGARVLFICREGPGALCEHIEARGYRVARLPAAAPTSPALSWQEDAAASRVAITAFGGPNVLLVVDHYGLDARWESALRPLVGRILVLDDLADRPHDCDLLLDQSLHDDPEARYANLVAGGTRVFLGPSYALLREEFAAAAPRLRDQGPRRLLIFFGGDAAQEVEKTIDALRALEAPRPAATVVLGHQHTAESRVRQAAQGLAGVEILAQTDEMSRLMAAADLGIGTCGGAAWERCAVGLPALVVVTADNQRDDARALDRLGAVRNLGDAAAVTTEDWCTHIRSLEQHPAMLLAMSHAAVAVLQHHREGMCELQHALIAGVSA
jgi:UDP-2,4-diacetamido-2,4,6-trideoxy-beta-L-altropyranose hydrolase